MGNIQVSKHIQEMEQFLDKSEQLKICLDNLDNVEDANRNDLYEIVYSKKEIERWLSQGVENQDIKSSLEELLEDINIILKSLSEKQLNNIVSRDIKNTKDIEKLNQIKYNNKKEYKGLIDKKEIIARKKRSLLEKYFLKRLPSLIIMGILMLLLFNGTFISANSSSKVNNTIVNELNDKGTNNSNIVKNNTISADINNQLVNIKHVTEILIGLGFIVFFTLVMLKIAIDMLYISIPMFREMKLPFLSDEIKEIIELDAYESETQIHKIINYRDRFETATALLHNTELWINEVGNFNNKSNLDLKSKHKINQDTQHIKDTISNIYSRIEESNIINKIDALVDAEILYNKYKSDIDNTLKES